MPEPVEVLHLVVPPYAAHLEAVRAVAGHAADRAGLEADDREDLCLAVDELCQLVVGATDFALLVTLAAHPSMVLARVVARRRDGAAIDELSSLAAAVLARAVDFYTLGPSDDAVEGMVVKCRAGTRR
ncbi:MAG TPA: hypothetical protein VG869_10150 [Acidimicrobiia bacterium]|jgi:hypothetical protein|nr:hypothetical protein [Acidimicrobiia bacterium]